MSSPLSPPRHWPAGQQPESFDPILPSLTDGPTASTTSMRRADRPSSDGKKCMADSGKFRFGLPFGRNKDKKKKKQNDETKRKSKSSSPDTVTNPQRHSWVPGAIPPEAPEPPAATQLFGELASNQNATHGGTAARGLPPSPPPIHPLYSPSFSSSAHYPYTLDPRFQRQTIYEERVPPSHRASVPDPDVYIQTKEALPPFAVRANVTPGAPGLIPERSRAPYSSSVYQDAEPQSPLRRQPAQQFAAVPNAELPVAVDQPELNADVRRNQLREEARERQRQDLKIKDLEDQLKQANEDLARAEAREAESERLRHMPRQYEQPQPQARPATATQQPRPDPAPYGAAPQAPRRWSSQRVTASRDERKGTRFAEHRRDNEADQEQDIYPPQSSPRPPLRRHDSQRTERPRDIPADQQASSGPPPALRRHATGHSTSQPLDHVHGSSGRGGSSEVQARIAQLQADIQALRHVRHTVEDDLVRRLDADERQEMLERERAYERLVGGDRNRDRERERERRHREPREREEHSMGQAMRRSMQGMEALRRSAERRRSGRGDEAYEDERGEGSGERPYSWERKRRGN